MEHTKIFLHRKIQRPNIDNGILDIVSKVDFKFHKYFNAGLKRVHGILMLVK